MSHGRRALRFFCPGFLPFSEKNGMIFYSENHAGLPRFLSGGPEMERTTTVISQADIDRQLDFCRQAAAVTAQLPTPPLAFVDTYGCPLV